MPIYNKLFIAVTPCGKHKLFQGTVVAEISTIWQTKI